MADPRFFRNQGPFTAHDLAHIGGAQISALPSSFTEETLLHDVAPLQNATEHDVTVLHNRKYLSTFKQSKAGLCITFPDLASTAPPTMIVLTSETPYRAYALIARAFYPDAHRTPLNNNGASIASTATIGDNFQAGPGVVIGAHAKIGNNVTLEANVTISNGVEIGNGCYIGANTSISHSLIGKHVTIHPGARLGQSGFGFFMDEKGHVDVPQLGRVIVEDYVEVGANTTIDRGSTMDTVIGAGSRIDNLVQIAHNVVLGKGCVIVSQVGISGSTKIGDYTIIAGQAGLTGHLTIGKRVRIAAQSGVMRDLEDGAVVAGSPAIPATAWHRQTVTLAQLINKKRS